MPHRPATDGHGAKMRKTIVARFGFPHLCIAVEFADRELAQRIALLRVRPIGEIFADEDPEFLQPDRRTPMISRKIDTGKRAPIAWEKSHSLRSTPVTAVSGRIE